MAHHGVFHGTKQAYGVYTEVLVEALVLSVYQGLEEIGTDFLIGYRGAVLIEELAYENTVGAVYLGRLTGLRIADAGEITGRLAKEPEEVDVNGS